MNNDLEKQAVQLEGMVKTIRIVSLAMLIGAVLPLIILCSIVDWQKLNANMDAFAIVAAAYGLVTAVGAFIIPGLVAKPLVEKANLASPDSQAQQMANAFQTQHIVKLAILEGAALLNAIVFFITQNQVLLGVALVLIALIAANLPTKNSILSWIDQKLATAD